MTGRSSQEEPVILPASANPQGLTGAHDSRLRVLCIWRPGPSGFRENDFEILGRAFRATLLHFRYTPLAPLQMLVKMRKHDVGFAWFAGLHAFLMVLFGKVLRKKTVIVCGGYDVARVPEIGYGLPLHPVLKHAARYALSNADLVLSISRSSQRELYDFANPKRHEMVYCCTKGVEARRATERKNQVITVGLISRESSARKGHLEFVRVARMFPDVPFLHVGKAKDRTIEKLRAIAPANVRYLGYLPGEQYSRTLSESKVYLQLSKHEGFGVSVMESMLHGCTPIVSNAGSLPEIVGDAGIVMDTSDPQEVADKIRWVFENIEYNEKAVARALEFSSERRAAKLIRLIQELANGRSGNPSAGT